MIEKPQSGALPQPGPGLGDPTPLSGLKAQSIRGGLATMAGQAGEFGLRMCATIALARLLTPADYGLVAMVTALTGFVEMFKDMGLSMATIQKADIEKAEVDTLFWVNVAVSLATAAITAALAPGIAWFYGEPRLVGITLLLSISFLFSGVAVQHLALLKRRMRFGVIAAVQVISLLIGVVTAVVMAGCGAGYWSLVVLQIVVPAANAAGVWLVSRWRPGWPAHLSRIRSMLEFGLNITGFNVVNYFARNADSILIGRFRGSSMLGLYSRASGLLMLPISNIRYPLEQVALPGLSRLQNSPDQYRRYYEEFLSLLSFVSVPFTLFAGVCAESIIGLMLGSRWMGTVPIFRILALLALIQPVAGTTGLVMISLGQTARYLKWGVFNSLFIVTAFVAGLPWGAVGVAASYTAAGYLILLPSLWYAFRFSPASMAVFFRSVARPVITGLIMAASIFAVQLSLAGSTDIVLLGAAVAVGVPVYLLAWLVLPGGRETLRKYLSYGLLLFRQSA